LQIREVSAYVERAFYCTVITVSYERAHHPLPRTYR